MYNITKKFIDLLVYSNIWIALAAAAMTCQTYIQLELPILFDALLLMVFSSTLATYNLARFMAVRKMSAATKKSLWFGKHAFWTKVLLFSSSIICAIVFWMLKLEVQLVLVASAAITLLYSLPFIPKQGKLVRLRDIGLVKIFLIAFTYALSTSILPLVNAAQPFRVTTCLMVLERFLFVFALTLPFDIRDMRYDNKVGLSTIPLKVGIANTLKLAYVSLFFLAVLAVYLYSFNSVLCIALWSIYGITAFVVAQTNLVQKDLFYTGLIDGLMVLSFLIVYMATYFF